LTIGQRPWRWDLVCRVVDNFGDAAVLWRLARQLSVEHDERVRLLVDQPDVLERLVPGAKPGRRLDGVAIESLSDEPPTAQQPESGGGDADVVVTGFHAALPPWYRRGMTARRPLWINLEYLSAEEWIDRFHGLPSPHADGLTEHFFYPGFTKGSGGLLRESDLLARRDDFLRGGDSTGFLAALGVQRRAAEVTASILCYPDAPLDLLAHRLASSSTRLHLLVPEGAAKVADDAAALHHASQGRLLITRIPFLPQRDYDRLLWSCDLNFVRGEDSLVRAVWSGRPFVWQIYPQEKAAHLGKLEAFLRLMPGKPLAEAHRWWNRVPGAGSEALTHLVAQPESAQGCLRLLSLQTAASDLTSRLLTFTGALAAVPVQASGTAGKL